MFAGTLLGDIIGKLSGINSNVGGVGFAMLFLILITNSKRVEGRLGSGFKDGINFWQSMYTPVVIAMTASQNVVGAINSGLLAILAGFAAIAAGFALLPLINRLSQGKSKEAEE